MIEQAKNAEDVTQFGEANAYFSLYNDSYGAVFYIVNEEKMKMDTTFELEMENMRIKGEPEGATEFTIQLGPGESTAKIIKTIDTNLGNQLAMSYSFQFKE